MGSKERSARYYAAHREEIKSKALAWAAANPEEQRARKARYRDAHRLQIREQAAQYRAVNAEKLREGQKRWRIDHPKRSADHRARYRAANSERVRDNGRAAGNRRRARKLAASVGVITERDLEGLIRRYRGECAYCGDPWEHFDHVVPLARGGAHSVGNLLPACALCNQSKGKKLLMEWRLLRRDAGTVDESHAMMLVSPASELFLCPT